MSTRLLLGIRAQHKGQRTPQFKGTAASAESGYQTRMRWVVVKRSEEERGGPVGVRVESRPEETSCHWGNTGALMTPGNSSATVANDAKFELESSSGWSQ